MDSSGIASLSQSTKYPASKKPVIDLTSSLINPSSFFLPLFLIFLLCISVPTYGGWAGFYAPGNKSELYSIQPTSDGGYIAAGQSWVWRYDLGEQNLECWVLKIDDRGRVDWEVTYGGTGADYARAATQTNDGGYIVAASRYLLERAERIYGF